MSEQSGPEFDNSDLESGIRETDPRDYLKISTFQKHARELDTDFSHPWEREPSGFLWSYDPGCEIMMSEISLGLDKPKGMLIAVETNSETKSMFVFNMDSASKGLVESELGTVMRRFPVDAKKSFVYNLIDKYPSLSLKKPDEIAFDVTEMALESLPDYSNASRYNGTVDLPKVSYGIPEATEWQKTALNNFLADVSKKMPAEDFQKTLDNFKRDIPFMDHVYGINFKYIFADWLGFVEESRDDTQINQTYNSVNNEHTTGKLKFPVKDLIKKQINSTEELRDVLSKMEVKPEPDKRRMEEVSRFVEFVDLEKVVGGPGINDWSIVSTSTGRGLENIKRIADLFSKGEMDVSGKNEPIYVDEINGEYFISQDGRHRVAALKALGVPFAPMFVVRFSQKLSH